MEHLTPPLLKPLPGLALEQQTHLLALCDDHLTREETLLADVLLSLRQVRDAFFQRNLKILPTLQIRQKRLADEATEMAAERERLRAALADLLGVSVAEATLSAAAQALPHTARERLLQRRGRLAAMLREIEQLCHHNAALLGYARGFFACLFSVGRVFNPSSIRYGRQGEPQDGNFGPLLEARV